MKAVAWKPSLSQEEIALFTKLRSPEKIQDFLDSLPANLEKNGETSYSPRLVLKYRKAHCFEGALFAAAVLWYHRERPLLLDLKTGRNDFDHVITLFKKNGYWGAISKTNHAVLRFRDPIYKTVRELALSYAHEYFLDSGKKTLLSYSKPFSLRSFGSGWITSDKPLWHIAEALDDSPHMPIAPPDHLKKRKLAHPLERKAGKLKEYS
jgi:hypothetical protein